VTGEAGSFQEAGVDGTSSKWSILGPCRRSRRRTTAGLDHPQENGAVNATRESTVFQCRPRSRLLGSCKFQAEPADFRWM